MKIIFQLLAVFAVALATSSFASEMPRQHLAASVSFDATAGLVQKAFWHGAVSGGGGGGGTVTFTPTALRFIAPASVGCNDSNNGTTTALAWCTPNHAMNCGDVILASPGTYLGSMATWGTVSNCPSTTAGIDGTGGINTAILLCAGSDIESCVIDCASAACSAGAVGSGGRSAPAAGMNINNNYWAVIGWSIKGNATAFGFQMDGCLTQTTQIHHVAILNSKVINALQGWDANDCAYNQNVPGNGGDYGAAVGLIAQNSAQASICLAALDWVGPSPFNSTAGTHTYINTNYVINSQSPSCGSVSDGEGIMIDTPDAHNYTPLSIISNNMVWHSMRFCIQLFYQNHNSSTPNAKVYNNTCYGNLTNVGTDSADGEINLASLTTTTPWTVLLQNNIAQTATATSGSSKPIYAFVVGGVWNTFTNGGTGNENIFKGLQTGCPGGASCDAGFNTAVFSGGSLGTNLYTSPAFTNVSDLTTNWLGAPNCAGFVTTTACMGYNANTSTLTTLTPISDLVPTAGGMTGKGFQFPSITCAANSDYPSWLKGLNVLRASGWTAGAVITQYSDLATKPCGL